MKAYFTTFKKRKNSTKQPSRVGAAERTVKLKDNCSLHNPVLLVNSPSRKWTYCELDDGATTPWIGYFFISDMVQVANDLWEVYLESDPMAEARTDIGNSIFHVAFSSMFTDKTIPDPRIMIKTTRHSDVSNSGSVLSMVGCYVLTVLNGITPGTGMGTTYIMKQACVQKVAQWFTAEYQNFISQYFQGSPMDGVFSLIWVPFSFPSTAGIVPTDIVIGNRSMVGDGYTIPANSVVQLTDGYFIADIFTVDCHLHYPVTDFRAVEPYTSGSLFLPGIGNVDVNMSDFVETDKIRIGVTKDYITGDLIYYVYGPTELTLFVPHILATYTCNVAAQCPLGQITTNANGAVGGLATLAGGVAASAVSLAAGNPLGAVGGAGAAIGGIANFVLSSNKRQASVSGNITGRGWTYTPSAPGHSGNACIIHTELYVDTEDPDDLNYIAERGRPLGEMKTISTLAGYVQCEGASLYSDSVFAEDYDTVNNYLNSGFFYE